MSATPRRRALSASLVVAFVAVLCTLSASPASAAAIPFGIRTIGAGLDGVSEATTADIDSDGDIDVVAAGALDDTLSWFINDGTPDVGAWTEVVIATGMDVLGVDAGDV